MKEKSTDAIEKPTGVLMYSLASSNIKDESQIKFVSNYIANKKLASAIQLTGMMLLSSEREGGEAGIDQVFYYISELLCASWLVDSWNFFFIVWSAKSKSVFESKSTPSALTQRWREDLQPFNSHRWPRHNFSLQYQYNIKQTSYEDKEKYWLENYQ